MTFKELKDKLRAMIWVFPGEPKSLRSAHDLIFLAGMNELQNWVACLKLNNTNVYPQCATFIDCAKTIVDTPWLPDGQLQQVYTIPGQDQWCNRVYYHPCKFEFLETWIHNLITTWTPPVNTLMPALTKGIKVADATTDSDKGRAQFGYYAIRNKKLYIAPWIQSQEIVVIEWDGPKAEWSDQDLIDTTLWGIDAQMCLAAFVKWQSKLSYPEQSSIATPVDILKKDYDDKLADMIYWCEKALKEGPIRETERRLMTKDEVDAGNSSSSTAAPFYGNVGEGFGT